MIDINYVRIFLASTVVLFLPGWFFYKFLFRKKEFDTLASIPISFCLSLIILTLPTVAAYNLHLSLKATMYFYFMLALLVIALAISKKDKTKPSILGKDDEDRVNKKLRIAFIISLFIISILGFYFGGFIGGDAFKHISIIRKIIALPNLFLKDCFIEELNSASYGYSLWHMALAIISRISGSDPIAVWIFLPMITVPMIILSVFSFSKVLFKDSKPAYIVSYIYIAWFGLVNYNYLEGGICKYWGWSLSPYASFVGRDIVLSVLFLFVFRYIYNEDRRCLSMVPFMGFMVCLVHPYYFFVFLLISISFCIIYYLLLNKDRVLIKELFAIIICTALITSWYIVMILTKITPIENPAYLSYESVSSYQPIVMLKGKYPIIHLFKGLWQGPLRILSYLFLPLLIFYVLKRKRWAIFLFTGIAIPTLILINPFLLFYFQRFNPSLERLYLLTLVIPYIYICGICVYKIAEFINKKWKKPLSNNKIKQILGTAFILVVILFLFASLKNLSSVRPRSSDNIVLVNRQLKGEFIDFVNRNIPVGSVVFSDKFTSISWTVYFPHYVVAIAKYFHMEPNIDPIARLKDMDTFFREKIGEDSIDILDRYGADYVAINKRFIKKDLDGYPEKFERIYDSEEYRLYKYLKN